MTLHAVLVLTDNSPTPDVVDDVHGANADLDTYLPGRSIVMHAADSESNFDGTVTPAHARGEYRHGEATAQSTLLDKIENAIPSQASWYAIYYHNCDHDLPATMRDGCGDWQAKRASGDVPSEVKP